MDLSQSLGKGTDVWAMRGVCWGDQLGSRSSCSLEEDKRKGFSPLHTRLSCNITSDLLFQPETVCLCVCETRNKSSGFSRLNAIILRTEHPWVKPWKNPRLSSFGSSPIPPAADRQARAGSSLASGCVDGRCNYSGRRGNAGSNPKGGERCPSPSIWAAPACHLCPACSQGCQQRAMMTR